MGLFGLFSKKKSGKGVEVETIDDNSPPGSSSGLEQVANGSDEEDEQEPVKPAKKKGAKEKKLPVKGKGKPGKGKKEEPKEPEKKDASKKKKKQEEPELEPEPEPEPESEPAPAEKAEPEQQVEFKRKQYFYNSEQKRMGPVKFPELCRLFAEGQVDEESMVWYKALGSKFVPLGEHPDLLHAVQEKAVVEKKNKKAEASEPDDVSAGKGEKYMPAVWHEVSDNLPCEKSQEDKDLRAELFQRWDMMEREVLKFNEIEIGLRQTPGLQQLGKCKPAVRRAYEAAKALKRAAGDEGCEEDNVTAVEFRMLLVYLKLYYGLHLIFDGIDHSNDKMIDEKEFKKAAPMLKEWGAPVNTENPRDTFRRIDRDGSGELDFDEFVDWAIANNVLIKPVQAKQQQQQSQVIDDLMKEDWKQISERLPVHKNDVDKEKRKDLFRRWDPNGNGMLSLAEIDKGIKETPGLEKLSKCKPAMLRAYNKAKDIKPGDPNKKGLQDDDYVTPVEFRMLLVYLKLYYGLFQIFDEIDTGDDRRVDRKEFKAAVPQLKEWGCPIEDPDETFEEIDEDGHGQILFDEFSEWAIEHNFLITGEVAGGDAAGKKGEDKKAVEPAEVDVEVAEMTMKLDMDFDEVEGNEEEFSAQLKDDLASAIEGDPAKIKVSNLRAGSVIADIAMEEGVCGDGVDLSMVTKELKRQAADPDSPLRQGEHTSACKGLDVHGISKKKAWADPDEDKDDDDEEEEEPKASNRRSSVVDDLMKEDWKTLCDRLPVQKNDEERAKRQALFMRWDPNGNGMLSLAEIDKGIKETPGLEKLSKCKPAMLRAYNKAKDIKPGDPNKKGLQDDDYVTGVEFRMLLVYLKLYYGLFQIFDEIDTGDDRRVDRKEFKAAVPQLKDWGCPIEDPDETFEEIDEDGHGQILFDEFSEWAIENNLLITGNEAGAGSLAPRKIDEDDEDDEEEEQPRQASAIDELMSDTWKEVANHLPVTKSEEDTTARAKLFRQWDPNGNGLLSLAEIDKGIKDTKGLEPLFACKPAILRSYKAAKAVKPGKSGSNDDDYVSKVEFRMLLVFLKLYFGLYQIFDQIDTGDDRRVDKEEFRAAADSLREWGCPIAENPDETFDEIDDGGGQILFDEFSEWAIGNNYLVTKSEAEGGMGKAPPPPRRKAQERDALDEFVSAKASQVRGKTPAEQDAILKVLLSQHSKIEANVKDLNSELHSLRAQIQVAMEHRKKLGTGGSFKVPKDNVHPPPRRAASLPAKSTVLQNQGARMVFDGTFGPPPPLIPVKANRAQDARARMREKMREDELRRLEQEDRIAANKKKEDPAMKLARAQMQLEARYAPPPADGGGGGGGGGFFG